MIQFLCLADGGHAGAAAGYFCLKEDRENVHCLCFEVFSRCAGSVFCYSVGGATTSPLRVRTEVGGSVLATTVMVLCCTPGLPSLLKDTVMAVVLAVVLAVLILVLFRQRIYLFSLVLRRPVALRNFSSGFRILLFAPC